MTEEPGNGKKRAVSVLQPYGGSGISPGSYYFLRSTAAI